MLEREKAVPEGLVEIPHTPEIPPEIEKGLGVKPVPSNFTAQVKQSGQNLITTPQNQAVTITLPTDPQTLTTQSKGPITDAVTWFSVFWWRMIKKALHFGWKIVQKK